MQNLAIIQARLGSTRLPRKVLLPIQGMTVIEHLVQRVQESKLIDDIIVATSIEPNNLPLIQKCSEKKIRITVGSENDVLDRYYQTARLFNPKNIIRITGDCPLIDFEIIDQVINAHQTHQTDYTSNVLPPTFPDGLDVEIFTFQALERAWHQAKSSHQREHVTPYLNNNPQIELFSKFNLENSRNLADLRWTLDHPEDYQLIKLIFDHLYPSKPKFLMTDILELLDQHPEFLKINNNIVRNETCSQSE